MLDLAPGALDCDYLDGELEERNVGEKDHSAVPAFFIKWFAAHEEELGLEAYPEIRVRISPKRVRVADVAILPIKIPFAEVLTRPPVAIVEVLSPEGRVSRYEERLDDYRSMDVPHIWVIDPMRHKAYDYSRGGWQPVETLQITSPAVRVSLDGLWKKLADLHS